MNFGPEWMRKASIHGNVGTAVPASQNPAPHPGFGRGGAAPLPTSLTGWNTAVGGGQNASKAPSSPVGTRRPVSATELMLTPGHPIPGPRNTGASQYQSVASNGMSTSFPSNAGMMGSHIPPAATSEYRYSRDIMLSLFDPDYPTPENMEFHDFVMSRTAREPMANTPLTQNERKLLASNNVNSDPRGSGSANPQNNNAGQTGAPSAPGRFSRDRGQSGDGISSAGPTVGGIGRGIGRGTPIRRYDRTSLTEGDRQSREDDQRAGPQSPAVMAQDDNENSQVQKKSVEELWDNPVDENGATGIAPEERPPSAENGRKREHESTTSLPHLFDDRNLDVNLKRTASPAPNMSSNQADAASPSVLNEDVPSNFVSPSGYGRAFSVPSVGVQKARNAAPGTPSRSASTDEYARDMSARQSMYDIFGSRGVMFENETMRSGGLSSAGLLDDVRVSTAALGPSQALGGASPVVGGTLGVSALGAALSSAGLAGSIGGGPLTPSIATTLAYSGNSRVQTPPVIGLGVTRWLYKDNAGLTQGPFSAYDMQEWHKNGFLELNLMLKRLEDPNFEPFSKLVARYGIEQPFLNELEDKERIMRFMLASQQARGAEYGALFAGEYVAPQPQQQQWPQWGGADANSVLEAARVAAGAGAGIGGATIGSYTSSSYGNAYASPYANVQSTAAGRYANNTSLFESGYAGSVGAYAAHSGVRDWGLHNTNQVVADVLSAGSAPALSYAGIDPAVSLVPQGVTSPVSPVATRYHGEPEAPPAPQADGLDKIEEEEGVFGEMEPSPAEPAPALVKHQERARARLDDDHVQEDLANGASAAASEGTSSKKKSKSSKKKDRGVSVVVSPESNYEPSAQSAKADSVRDDGGVSASPAHQTVAPWAAAASDNASAKLSLKEIQELEERARQEREKEKAKRAAAALAAHVAVLKLQEANASATTSHSVWGSPAPTVKEIKETPAGESKTLAEIMAEEEERKKRELKAKNAAIGVAVREEAVAALSGVKRFADAANVVPPKTGWGAGAKATVTPITTKPPVVAKPAVVPVPANPSTAWNVVGKAGQARPVVAPSAAAARAGPPSAGVLAAPRPAVVPSSSSATVVVAQPVDPFLKWCRSALKPVERGLSINVDDFIGILMSIPRSETSTLLSVCDDTLGGLTAIDPRKFGEEFIRRRAAGGGSADGGAVSPDSGVSGGAERSVPGVVKGVTGAALDDFDTGNRFVTVGGKGKKKKQKSAVGK